MVKESININRIPAILWGKKSSELFIAVHGNLSSKSDVPIAIFAEEAVELGYQVISFDLPEHGDRKNEPTLCKVQNCVEDLKNILDYANSRASRISLFANSMGTYFSLLAYKDIDLKQSLFLSPLVDMNRMINNMMMWFNITEQRLESEKEILTPIGHTLYWDYYQYVKQNPITKWDSPTSILYGEKDEQCEYEVTASFAKDFNCNFDIVKNAEHYFHTQEQLESFRAWVRKYIV